MAVDSYSFSGTKYTPGEQKNVSLGSVAESSGRDVRSLIPADKESRNKDTDDVDIGFVPSFLEAGKQPRQKRYNLLALLLYVALSHSIYGHKMSIKVHKIVRIKCTLIFVNSSLFI